MKQIQIQAGKSIQQRTGRTFHFATRLLPERVRHPTYVLYGFFRICDEVVDDAAGVPPEVQLGRLDSLRKQALGATPPDDPVLDAFRSLREIHGIDDAEVVVFVESMASDVTKSRYAEYDELETYMRGSAAAVGRMMTSVMAPDDPDRARPHATALGEAFQLTNFLRDVREDVVERDRIYLPKSTLSRHGVSEEQIERLEFSEEFAAVVHDELRRAESLYRTGVRGIQFLPEDCQFAVLLAAILYAEHHRAIRARGYDVLTRPPSLGTFRKLVLVVQTRWHWRKTRDPETVFQAVSAVGRPTRRGTEFERRDPLLTR